MASKRKEQEVQQEEDVIYMTEEGKKKLEDELHRLIGKEHHILEAVRESRKVGEFVEDSDYDDAKKEQALIEGRIEELQQILKMVQVIDKKKIRTDKVGVGCIVELRDLKNNRKVTYQIVGPFEADPLEGKISYESPVGEALWGKKVGDVVEVHAPAGVMKFKVEKIGK